MILTCPACGTRYAVKDGAIPPGGRQVRCANCKNSWHQDPEPVVSTPEAAPGGAETPSAGHASPEEFPAPAPFTHPAGEPGGKPAEAALSDHAHPDEPAWDGFAEEAEDPDAAPLPMPGASTPMAGGADELSDHQAPIEATSDPSERFDPLSQDAPEPVAAAVVRAEPIEPADDFAAFDNGRPVERGSGRGLIGLLLALLLIAVLVAAFWFFAPTTLKERLGLAEANDTPLLVQVDERNRRTLASGNQLLEVSGRIINPSAKVQSVPPLQAQLRSLNQQVVYRWTIPPPTPTLQPGGSTSFNSAELNIPASAACLDVLVTRNKPLDPCKAADVSGQGVG
ncbi:zinc-ribbon domain-containing protein [Sphingomonas sp. BN140010]|uniref:Zinc-ribbon domain-containing protein n=1 Tax=Sphingomonas arvum TaxID=2992113 RepID=A0ABT3JFC0_9SPHN|nr:zinc-ribbon domain-containing protein [Sphingomonas sp. BN140010]MCW3797754.1 zinc-ribbon domain-containing protein [Sphingomonas sp. BN140010]